ncbi:MAG: DUF4595 domain-containing protein [Paludibacteraceae bacterium]|nr:DUF4595 domain-containing protein [Paludibacteraceae bacterium]
MKKFVFPLCILALSAGFFTSCDDDDDDNNDNGTIVINQNLKKLVYASYDEDGAHGIRYEYDSKGRLVKAYWGSQYSDVYVYNGNTVTGTSFTEDWNNVLSGKLNANGFIETMTSQDKNDGSVSVENFTYDKDGHMIKNTSKGDYYYSEDIFVWVNGDIVSGANKYDYKESEYDEETNYSFKYTNDVVTEPIENKACILFAHPYLEVLSDHISLRNLVGVAGKHLPVSAIDNKGNENKFEWTFDADGYPIKVVDKYSTLYLTWE